MRGTKPFSFRVVGTGTRVTLAFVLALLLPAAGQARQGAANWERFAPAGESFSVLLPGVPEESSGSKLFTVGSGDLVEADFKVYRLFAGGTLYEIQSYEVSRPDEVVSQIFPGGQSLSFGPEFESGGYKGRAFTSRVYGLVQDGRHFRRGRRLYIIRAARRSGESPDIARFLDSFAPRQGGPSRAGRTSAAAVRPATGRVFGSKEVTRTAIILHRQSPSFTREARRKGTQGIVKLEATLLPSGSVADIKLLSGLPHGLTEQAMENAKLVVFLPAEKDGAHVALRIRLEYRFSID